MSLDRIPLIIGITGHRELHSEDVARVEEQLRKFFEGLQKKFPHTPLLLLSSMGEGADRLAARIAVETPGVSLAAVLPWPKGVCEDAWYRGGDRAEFDAVLANAAHTICLPHPAESTAAELCASPEVQQKRFADVSRYITRHCQILVAIWSGEESPRSQTWQVIQWQRNGTDAPFAARLTHLDSPETGPLHHLAVRGGAPTAKPSKQEEARYQAFQQMAGNFDRFNADTLKLGAKLEAGMANTRRYVFPEDEQSALPKHLQFLLSRFAQADQLAVHWQKKSLRVLFVTFSMIFLTVASFEGYAHVMPDSMFMLVAYPLLLATGLAYVWWTRRQRCYNRYLDDRALAEAMRVHLFWKLAGVRENAADFYLRTCRSQLDWIRAALRSWSLQSGEHDCGCPTAAGATLSPAALKQICRRWMRDQLRFFRKNTKRDHRNAEYFHIRSKVCLRISMAGILIQLGRLYFVQQEHLGHDKMTHLLIIVIAMGGLLAGLFHEYAEKRLFEKQSRSYQWMAALYKTALIRFLVLAKEGRAKDICDLMRELGREALAENADWVIYHREQEPEMKGH